MMTDFAPPEPAPLEEEAGTGAQVAFENLIAQVFRERESRADRRRRAIVAAVKAVRLGNKNSGP